MKVNDYQSTCLALGLSESLHNELKIAMTHKSFLGNDKGKDNSRYIFYGMFYFKGLVANFLFKNAPGSGTHLQHQLGNICATKILNNIYQHYKLGLLVRVGDRQEVENMKHLFAWAILGLVAEFRNENTIQRIIRTHFLPHLKLDKKEVPVNLKEQLKYICLQRFNTKPTITTLKQDEVYITTVECKAWTVEHSSSSHIYSQKQAIKKMLRVIATSDELHLSRDETYQNILEQKNIILDKKVKEERAFRIESHRAKQLKNRENRSAKKMEITLIKEEKDLMRANLKVKQRQQKEALAKKEKLEASTPMSTKKLRFFEDKKK